jgi:NAD(P)-dependent dehydrogenase (short-subunit alcohol dehydrogenase family)
MNSIIIIGAGPGIGAAVARRFARENFSVALIARKQETLEPLLAELAAAGGDVIGELADAGDEQQLAHALTRIEEQQGVPTALVYNAAVVRRDKPGELGRDDLLASWETNVLGGYAGSSSSRRKNGSAGKRHHSLHRRHAKAFSEVDESLSRQGSTSCAGRSTRAGTRPQRCSRRHGDGVRRSCGPRRYMGSGRDSRALLAVAPAKTR